MNHWTQLILTRRAVATAQPLPDLVEGLYLHGSLGFGEWYVGGTDIDFVAVLACPPTTSGASRQW